jgi:hypothetical protein
MVAQVHAECRRINDVRVTVQFQFGQRGRRARDRGRRDRRRPTADTGA